MPQLFGSNSVVCNFPTKGDERELCGIVNFHGRRTECSVYENKGDRQSRHFSFLSFLSFQEFICTSVSLAAHVAISLIEQYQF